MKTHSVLSTSPIQKVHYQGFDFYVKRDDLLNPYFSGNKARKFAYYLEHISPSVTKIVGYGSIQANSLYSLAALAHLKGLKFDYYVDRIPPWLLNSGLGNYAKAIELGANIIEKRFLPESDKKTGLNLDTLMRGFSQTLPNTSLFIQEGGRSVSAEFGVHQLAQELADFISQKRWIERYSAVNIMLPAGTGTTALFLQSWFKKQQLPINVLTCACVGDDTYLEQQFSELKVNKSHWPTILPTQKKYHFGKLYAEHFKQWKSLLDNTQIEFDLLYDPAGWESILHYVKNSGDDSPIIYIHQGGLIGNETMLPRYRRKFPDLF